MSRRFAPSALALIFATTLSSGCATPSGPAGQALTRVDGFETTGQLLEARCLLTTGETDGDHSYCAFVSARAQLPLLLKTAGRLIRITNASSELAKFVTKAVRVRGTISSNGEIMEINAIELASPAMNKSTDRWERNAAAP